MSDAMVPGPGGPNPWGPPVVRRPGWWQREFAEPLGVAAAGAAVLLVLVEFMSAVVTYWMIGQDVSNIGIVSSISVVVGLLLGIGAVVLGMVAIVRGRRRGPSQLAWVGVAVGGYAVVTSVVQLLMSAAMRAVFG